MKHEWIVVVKDEAKAEITDAEVGLVEKKLADLEGELPYAKTAATHSHAGAGKYTSASITPADGDWTLIVRRAGKSPAVQTLKLKESKGIFTAAASPRRADTVDMKAETVTVSGDKVTRVTFTVTLHPASEVVFNSGTDMNVGSSITFNVFAEDRRDVMRREKKLDDGALATILSCDHRSRRTFVHAGDGWLMVHEKKFGVFNPAQVSKPHTFVVGSDISAVDVYLYLDHVGKNAPGRVKEVGWFGHAFGGGPVLWNTFDTSGAAARDPDDHDARAKDFNPTQIAKWPDLKKALHPDCVWRTWGCRADTHDRRRIFHGEKEKKSAADKLFTATTEDKDHGKTITETMTREFLNAFIDAQFRQSYCASATKLLGIPCLGAPPGVGSDLFTVSGLHLQMVDLDMYSYVYSYLRDQFGPQFKDTGTKYDKGYVDYKPVLTRAALSTPALGPGRYQFTDKDDHTGWTLEWEGKSASGTGKVRLEVADRKGFGDKKLDGFLYQVVNRDDKALSQAFFASDESGVTIYRVDRGPKDKFDKLGPKL